MPPQKQAHEDLKELADNSCGEFTLVIENGEILHRRDIEMLVNK